MVSTQTPGKQWHLLIEVTSKWLASTVCNADGRGELPYSACVCVWVWVILCLCMCKRVCVLSLVSICISRITFSFFWFCIYQLLPCQCCSSIQLVGLAIRRLEFLNLVVFATKDDLWLEDIRFYVFESQGQAAYIYQICT